jgi:hypothetical protein
MSCLNDRLDGIARLPAVTRRLLLLLLMLMMPLQWSWAVAASVCAHEADAQVSHFAHHEHEHETPHESAQSSDTDTADTAGFGAHPDCGVCHGLGTAFFAALDRSPQAWPGGSSFMPYEAAVPNRTVDTLLRPPLTLVS